MRATTSRHNRDAAMAMAGATVASLTLIAAQVLGRNQVLTALSLALAGLTAWSAVDWRQRPRRPAPVTEPATITGTESGGPRGTAGPIRPGPTKADGGALDHKAGNSADPSADSQPVGGHPDRLAALDDLLNDLPVREFQCGACASFSVRPAERSGLPSGLRCDRCGRTTPLTPSGRPHAVMVRSNPERGLERSTNNQSQVKELQ